METLLGILVIIALIVAYKWLAFQWGQWSGACGRWCRGDPLRAWEANLTGREDSRALVEEERQKLRSAYELSPGRILVKSFRERFIELGLDQIIKDEVRSKYGFTCCGCGCTIKKSINRHVDHIKPKKHHPELEFYVSNLQVLCRTCNAHKSTYTGEDWQEVVAERRKATLRKRLKQRRVLKDLN